MLSVTDCKAAGRLDGTHEAPEVAHPRWHRPLLWFAAASAAWAVVCAVGLLVDPRAVEGHLVWAKPLKFSLSFGVYALTLALLLVVVQQPRLHRAARWAGTVGALASLLEMAVISVQAIRGTSSHFNVSSQLDTVLYAAMGGGVVLVYLATLAVGIAAAFFGSIKDSSMEWSLRLGLPIAVAGLSVGFVMVAPRAQQLTRANPTILGSHSVGGDDPTTGLPFLGWNTVHGDLRVAHFLGMHALQGLPLIAIALAVLTAKRFSEGTRLRLVLLSSGAWAALTALTLWQALRGQSVIHPDGLTWASLGAIAAGSALGVAAIWRYHLVHPGSIASDDTMVAG